MKLKSILAACAFVAVVHYSSLAAPVPSATWTYYQSLGNNIAGLKAKGKALNKAYSEESRKLALQAKAGQISESRETQIRTASSLKLTTSIRKIEVDIAALELKRIAIEERYKIKP